ncbi:ATP-dependent RNA helicase RhlE [Litorivivens lipolytica]|uniref:ATP-dependent RNA helicase RhlE n=1 Tax=Litorivivens lipolytica TaxID=1524264 RepID=A0A7W4W5B0_9GAMM|nr:DEAD/DEAH box helicase [Litorivivens lipolytica]MBB3047751.1 ATP-dependent RNA helicase RhlE [Litorivivens lipolytica]
MTFATLGLSDALVQAVETKGYSIPSPIQEQAIPVVLQGKDLMAAAQTGTGKTAGFTLPILELLSRGQSAKPNRARALILTPTRELAAQVGQSVVDYGHHMKLRSTVVFGGVKINPQMMALRKGADILVATPGRLLDLYQQNAVRFDDLEILVLDEADRMLDMGFIHDIKKILNVLPKKRQNLLFSATFSGDIRNLAKGLMNDPEEISVSPRNTTATTVKQVMHPVDKAQKPEVLIELIKTGDWHQVLVFSRTKHGANRLAKKLDSAGIRSAAIHGNKSQAARLRALDEFKRGNVQVLVATDIAARGLDISQLPHVVNFDLPNVAEDYVHRIGRTGRAGAEGEAVSLVSADEIKQLQQIEQLIGKSLPREYVDGFEPNHEVPASQRIRQPHKPKAKTGPKKPSQRRSGGNSANGNRAGGNRSGGNASGKPNAGGNNAKGNQRGNSSGQAPAKRKPRPPRARRAD